MSQSNRQTMARLSGWANKDRRKWIDVAERGGLLVERLDRGSYNEWRVTRDGATIGFLHEFPDEIYAFTHTSWEVTGRLRRLWHRLRNSVVSRHEDKR
jgi:hypothetical protein